MKELIIVNFEEIYLKGQNRKLFARALREQLKKKLKAFPELVFGKQRGGSLFLELKAKPDAERRRLMMEIIRRTPGVTGLYSVWTTGTDKDKILEAALSMARERLARGKSFRITARRLRKDLPYTSRDLAVEAGALIASQLGNPVDLTHPDWTLNIKVRPEQTLIYDKIVPGIGGLPVGTSGKGVVMLSGGIDSPVAARMMINRGMQLTAVHFHSMPETSPQSVEKVKDLTRVLTVYQPVIKLILVPVLEIQRAIARHTDSKMRLILLRRFMLAIATALAEEEGAGALVTGDSLGQVASQTLENMRAISAVTSLPVLRPLVALDKKEIIRRARDTGTYDISVLPHDDACAMFTPDNPETRAHLGYTENQWQRLDTESLIREALLQKEEHIFRFNPENIRKFIFHV
ncbi:MAG: tRNA 4-thiouridine(8) synthase ThiI [Chlorobi bacterium]|nr:tRNA 4-thiouridine(8) synthase ThiI [Chlorobiota bacterium]